MINIAELLKDAPKGMKLYSPLFGEVEFAEVMDTDYVPIRVIKRGYGLRFDECGRYMGNEYPDSECLLFPSKDCRTWEGWKLPVEPKFKVNAWIISNITKDIYQVKDVPEYFKLQAQGQYRLQSYTDGSIAYFWKNDVENTFHLWSIADAEDGDVLAASDGSIFIYAGNDDGGCKHHMALAITGSIIINEGLVSHWETASAVKPATKEQRDLLFAKMEEAGYELDANKMELKKLKKHYDISNFKPFDNVLVRDGDKAPWRADFFEEYDDNFYCFRGAWEQCIPFNGDTKHLIGTTEMCPQEYINW